MKFYAITIYLITNRFQKQRKCKICQVYYKQKLKTITKLNFSSVDTSQWCRKSDNLRLGAKLKWRTFIYVKWLRAGFFKSIALPFHELLRNVNKLVLALNVAYVTTFRYELMLNMKESLKNLTKSASFNELWGKQKTWNSNFSSGQNFR